MMSYFWTEKVIPRAPLRETASETPAVETRKTYRKPFGKRASNMFGAPLANTAFNSTAEHDDKPHLQMSALAAATALLLFTQALILLLR